MDLQDFLKSNAFTQSSSNAFNFTSNNIDLSKINETPKAAPKAHDLNDFLSGKASSLDPSAEKTINSSKTYVEFPVPDYPPFMATFCNFPPDITEEGVKNWFEDGIQNPGCILNLNMPKNMDNTYKRRGFVEFKSKSDLEKALKLSGSFLNSNKLYVDVADPNTRINSNGRSGGFGGRYTSGLALNWSKGSGAVPQQNDSYSPSAQPVDWSKKGANQPERGVPPSAVDWSQKGQNFREPRSDGPSAASLDWAKKGQSIREPRHEGPSAASLDWAKKGQNVREPRQEGSPAASLDWAQKGQNIREPRHEGPSAASLDWAKKGQNVREPRQEGSPAPSIDWTKKGQNFREQSKPKTVSPTSYDWSKKGAFVDQPRSQRNSKNSENNEAKASTKTLGFDKLSLDEE